MLHKLAVFLTTPEKWGTLLVLGAVTLLWALAIRRRGARVRLTRDLVTDVVYWLFYAAGIFTLVGGTRVFLGAQAALHRVAPFLELNLVRDKPWWIQLLAVTVVFDFFSYWWHRAMHGSRLLWLVHRAHHSQTDLNPLTNYRVHLGEMFGRGLVLMFPAAVLGANAPAFAAAIWLQTGLNTLAHADLDWGFGGARFLVVSPMHHRVHHADDARSQRNYGILLSAWDYLFGTLTPSFERPERFGLSGETVPRGFLGQLIDPLLVAYRRLRNLARPMPAPAVVE
jgi:sterol desaturase/sphingolipid hydroxylase (fatty acid hydroxylase superfamily)